MRILLISDTHGSLRTINDLVEQTHADAVIHAGDFGFYSDDSYERLSARELRLLVIHSDLPKAERDHILTFSIDELVDAARAHRLAGDFQMFVEGSCSFNVPVYAVWGNHEDKDVVQQLFRGDLQIPNLNILHHQRAYKVGRAFLYGLGGNLLPGSKMMQQPIAGGGGRVWSTLSQYEQLVRSADAHIDPTDLRLFVSHVSPGTEPFIEFLGARTRADFTISGHMGAPHTMVWNMMTTRTVEDSIAHLDQAFHDVKTVCLGDDSSTSERQAEAFDFIAQLPNDSLRAGRGRVVPRWYRSMTHINLPDAHIGYAVLDLGHQRTAIETYPMRIESRDVGTHSKG